MKQSSHGTPALPAIAALLIAGGLVASSASAQERYEVVIAENFRQEPSSNGRLLARVNQGSILTGGARRGEWLEVTLGGWIWAQSVRPHSGDDFDLAVSQSGGENLRDGPNGHVVARLLTGFLLEEVGQNGRWIQVRRTGWMWGPSLRREVAAPASPQRTPSAPSPTAETADLDRVTVAGRSGILRTPDGDTSGTLQTGTAARVLARSGEWVRVQLEGWIRESDLESAAEGVLQGVTGAELRSRPQDFEGQLLQWTVEYVSLQIADELRRDIPEGRQYMLARGPLPENGFIYVVCSAEQVEAIEDLAPLTRLVMIGRVRQARSQYLGNPVLDLVDFQAVEG
jgi:hypothetical protein